MIETTLIDVLHYIRKEADLSEIHTIKEEAEKNRLKFQKKKQYNFQTKQTRDWIRDKSEKKDVLDHIGKKIYDNLLKEGYFYEQEEKVRLT